MNKKRGYAKLFYSFFADILFLCAFVSLIFLITLFAVGGQVCCAIDFNELKVLVYDGGGSYAPIQQAMQKLGIAYDLRTPSNPITATDLATHDILIVGRNYGDGDMSGLDPNILAAGVTGRILLTGHDADNHFVIFGIEAAGTFLSQSISFVAAAGGTGLVALGDSAGFSYLPHEWGISAAGGLCEDIITTFTVDGINSGVFDGLTPADMSNWNCSYHAKFTAWGIGFTSLELGGADGNDVVTIAKSYVTLTKTDDVKYCAGPCQKIKYTISYDYFYEPNIGSLSDVNIIDYLPAEVDFNSASGPNCIQPDSNTVVWHIGTLNPGDVGSVTLTVSVKCSQPNGTIENKCEIKSGDIVYGIAYKDTPVCLSCKDLWDIGLGNPADLNKDCKIDFYDFAIFAKDWGKCNDPQDPHCMPNW
jgi:hypothetical protein